MIFGTSRVFSAKQKIFLSGLLQLVILAYLALFSDFSYGQTPECFLLMSGKKVTESGQVLLAHNNDLTGTEASMLVRVTADHAEDIDNSMINHPSHNGILSNKGSLEMLVLQIHQGYAEGDAVAINEHGVAIAGGLALKEDRNSNAINADPLNPEGLGGGVRYLALQYAHTAKEYIILIGNLYNHYGIAYPSGVGIADSNEIWYLEAGGGSTWAAIRIPDTVCFVAANSYRIDTIDFTDTLNVITSPKLDSFCAAKGLWKEGTAFDFGHIFGGGRIEKYNTNSYNTRRIWRALDLLQPSASFPPNEDSYPMFVTPDQPITLEQCFTILRDHYKNTPYDPLKQVQSEKQERPIACWRGVHSEVISINPGEPVSFGTVLWTGLSTPYAAVFVPVYFGANPLPEAYTHIHQGAQNAKKEEQLNSAKAAFWHFHQLSIELQSNPNQYLHEWQSFRHQFEQQEIKLQKQILKEALVLHKKNPDKLESYLGSMSEELANKAIEMVYLFRIERAFTIKK
jgi:dipeptidase